MKRILKGRVWLSVLLAASLTVSLVFAAAGSWGLGPYQLVNGTSSGPLRMTMGPASLSSYGFVGSVGGIAFAGIAKPGPELAGKPVRLVYDPSKPDGKRFGLKVEETVYAQSIPDWILIPVARYADSEHNACVSLFGPGTTETQYDIVYHEAFENTLLGLRLLQADIMFIDLDEMWRLPQLDGRLILGQGERAPRARDDTAGRTLDALLDGQEYQSWVLTDTGDPIAASFQIRTLQLTGRPHYYFWRADQAKYVNERMALMREAEMFRRGQDISGYNRIVRKINSLEPRILALPKLTAAMREHSDTVRRYNPAVYDVAIQTMQYAAFFRYIKLRDQEGWRSFLSSLRGVIPEPRVATPVRWAR
jgi:hypothetical protein